MVQKNFCLGFILAAHILFSGNAAASEITLSSAGKGWWASENGDGPGRGNHVTGFLDINLLSNEYRSYYVFDVKNVGETIQSARLRIPRGAQSGPLAIGLWDVSTPVDVLRYARADNDELEAQIHSDLGSGKSYGTFSISNGAFDDYLEFVLNRQAVKELNMSSNYFAIGASVIDHVPVPDLQGDERYIFGYSGTLPVTLIVDVNPVPEPSSWLLVGIGAVGLIIRVANSKRRSCDFGCAYRNNANR